MISSMRSRCRLHLSKLDQFATFCEGEGWTREPHLDHAFEVLRLRKPGHQPIIVYQRMRATQHATIFGEGVRMFGRYINYKREAKL